MRIKILCDKIFTDCKNIKTTENQYTAYSFALSEAEKNFRKNRFIKATTESADGLVLNGFIKKAKEAKNFAIINVK